MRVIALTTLLLAGMASSNAAELKDFAGLFAGKASGLIFYYTAPMEGFHSDSPTLQGPSDFALARFLMDADGVDPLTGVDFSAVTGVLTSGDPPNGSLVLFGEEGFAAEMRDTLLSRGFEKRRIGDYAALGLGEDNAIDMQKAREPDPFAGGLGRAQRIALVDDFIAVTPNWATLERLIGSIEAPAGASSVWQTTFDALEYQWGEAHLDSAWGWGGDSFMAPAIDILLSPDADLDDIAESFADAGQLNFPPFPFAILAMDRSGDGATLRIALPYGDRQSAEMALDYAGRTLVYFPEVPDNPTKAIIEQDGLFIATLSLTYPVDEAAKANKLLLDWNGAIMTRSFAPLEFAY